MVLVEHHVKGKVTWNYENGQTVCECSYCKGDSKLHYGLNIPKAWRNPTSWFVIKYGPYKYIRFTRKDFFNLNRAKWQI